MADALLALGELVTARVFNWVEDPLSAGKMRPVVLVARAGEDWDAMGLTTLPAYRSGLPRVAIPNPLAVGLSGPGYLWGPNLVRIGHRSIARHVGWVDADLAARVIGLAGLSEPDAEALLAAAREQRDASPEGPPE